MKGRNNILERLERIGQRNRTRCSKHGDPFQVYLSPEDHSRITEVEACPQCLQAGAYVFVVSQKSKQPGLNLLPMTPCPLQSWRLPSRLCCLRCPLLDTNLLLASRNRNGRD